MATMIDTAQFEATHGKKPRGEGMWGFVGCRKVGVDAQAPSRPAILWVNGKYSVASKEAREHFAAMGVQIVVVLP